MKIRCVTTLRVPVQPPEYTQAPASEHVADGIPVDPLAQYPVQVAPGVVSAQLLKSTLGCLGMPQSTEQTRCNVREGTHRRDEDRGKQWGRIVRTLWSTEGRFREGSQKDDEAQARFCEGRRRADLPLASAGSDMIRWGRVLLSHTLDAARSY